METCIMWMALIWIPTLLLLGLWSLLAWAAWTIASGDMSFIVTWTTAMMEWLAATPLGVWLGITLPEWKAWLDWTAEMLKAFGGWLPIIVIIGWAFGAAVLAGFALLATAVLYIVRRGARAAASPGPT
jgi:hypothetical protein